ncbi:hemerythrin domain-containing protein [Microbacteriaceae bacterium VKM Ac-2855]|nr:hemerythrin domain-containing protein [Microbacteriaceae bacterium VKM Ac-2855]
MTERETNRLIAWSEEIRRVHTRLRDALRLSQDAAADAAEIATRDLLVYCHGFCTALDGHHRGEDRALFPAIEAEHPELAPVLRILEQDHAMIGTVLQGLRSAIDRSATPAELGLHLNGFAAIMESHFRFEERQLLSVLEELRLDADPRDVFGPL